MVEQTRSDKDWRRSGRRRSVQEPVVLIPEGVGRGIGSLLAVVAMLVAAALTAYAAVAFWFPQMLERLPVRMDLDSNLTSGVVFFWLELLAIVAGFRLYDRLAAKGQRKRRLTKKIASISRSLEAAIGRIWDERMRFAEALDANPTPYGSYDVDLPMLNRCIREIRDDFLARQLVDDDLTDHTRLMVDRVLRILDLMVEETYQRGSEVSALHARLRADHEDRRREPPSDEAPGDDNAVVPEPTPVNGQESGMDDLLGKLFESTAPDATGLERLSLFIADSFDALDLGRRSPRRKT